MKKIRIGNDIHFKWMITRDGAVENFKGKSVEVVLRDGSGKSWPVKWEVNEKDGCVDGVMYGQMQRSPGVYSLTLVENFGQKGMSTVDCIGAWQLVARQNNAVEGEDESGLGVSVVELKGDLSVGGGADSPTKRKRPNYYIFRRAIRYRSADDMGKRAVYMSKNPCIYLTTRYNGKTYEEAEMSVYLNGEALEFEKGNHHRYDSTEIVGGNVFCLIKRNNFGSFSLFPQGSDLSDYAMFWVEEYESKVTDSKLHIDLYLGSNIIKENGVWQNYLSLPNYFKSSSGRLYIAKVSCVRQILLCLQLLIFQKTRKRI